MLIKRSQQQDVRNVRTLVKNLSEIKQKIDELAEVVGASEKYLPTLGSSSNDGKPYVEVVDPNYYYLAFDGEIRTINRKTNNIDELLYWVFAHITFSMARDYEMAHRTSGLDHRRTLFSHQLELLGKINPLWREHRENEINDILKISPYED